MSQGKIVLMACGSFSPPTYMHLRMFEIARDYINSLGLGNVVGGIMSPVHDAYGKKDLVAAPHRISMLKYALRTSGWIKVSEWETQQAGWTRTRISMQYHQDAINGHLSSVNTYDSDPPSWIPDDILNVNSIDDDVHDNVNGNRESGVTVKLLCGADLLESFATPGLWSDEDLETIVGRHGLVVVSRAGSDPGRFIYESDMLYKHRNNVLLVTNYIANEVSSTVIRRLVRRGESAKYLTDDSVLSYIRTHKLYSPQLRTEYEDFYYIQDNLTYKRAQNNMNQYSLAEPINYLNLGIHDEPRIDETAAKKAKKTKYPMPLYTDSITPIADGLKPKMAYLDKVSPSYVPGKAVKIVSEVTKHVMQDDKVSDEPLYRSLDSYLRKDDVDYELYRHRNSEGNVEQVVTEPIKKRCSSTIRKLRPEDMKNMKKSKSEVSKLCDKMKSMKLKEKLKEKEGRNYRTRSCNDLVRLVLTKHGIHVISDTEAIV